MRGFLAGIAVGALTLALVAWTSGSWRDDGRRPRAEPRTPATAPVEAEPRTAPVVVEGRPGTAAFAAGEAWLAIGDAYVFGEAATRRDASDADLVCLDIRGSVAISCPHGAGLALAPMSAIGLPADAGKTAALVRDAPLRLDLPALHLSAASTASAPGVGFVRARDGTVYRLHVAEVRDDPHALARRALVRYARVPAREGGGEIDVPATDGARPIPVAAREALRRALGYQSTFKGASFIEHLRGEYETARELPAETTLDQGRRLLVDGLLRTKLTIPRGGAIFAAGGIDRDARVVLESYSGVGVMGDLAGTVDVKSYGYIYIDGDLTGTVNVDSYATVIIERDLLGTLRINSYTDLLLRGRIRGELAFESGNWSDFWFDGYWSRAELEALPGDLKAVTLHVRSSDLAPGKHEGVGTFGDVHVAEQAWERLGR